MNNMVKMNAVDFLASKPTSQIGRLLLESGKIGYEDIAAIMAIQKEKDMRFGDAALHLGLVDENDIKNVLSQQFAYTRILDKTSNLDTRLVAAFQPDSLQAEALRSLRSELMLRYFNKAPHLSLALVGTEDALGIALTTANLAIVFAQMGVRTLLIDANLRAPQLHTLFAINDRNTGLSDLLAGRPSTEPVEVPDFPSLYVLPAGTPAPNPQELLGSKHYSECLKDLKTSFDVILISTPPANATRDAQLIASQTGSCLLVAKQHESRFKDIEGLCSSLSALGVRFLGVALRQ